MSSSDRRTKTVFRCSQCGSEFTVYPHHDSAGTYGKSIENAICYKCGTKDFLTIVE